MDGDDAEGTGQRGESKAELMLMYAEFDAFPVWASREKNNDNWNGGFIGGATNNGNGNEILYRYDVLLVSRILYCSASVWERAGRGIFMIRRAVAGDGPSCVGCS